MSFKKRLIFFVVGLGVSLLTYNLVFASETNTSVATETQRILDAVKVWVNGRYDSSEQVQRDIDNNVPENLQHRLMHQLFLPVELPFLDGVVIYQQSSIDGSDDKDWIIRRGILHFSVSAETGQVHQRELSFVDEEKFYNVHRNPEQLDGLTIEDFTWRLGCDFKLSLREDGKAISGPMDFGTCRMINPGSGEDMIAEDSIYITPNEYWFLGRYRDKEGQIVWGTESDEMNKLKRVSTLEVGQ
ncbi:MAG: CpcT/CpeT family chromophore lyase [Rhodospirillaceae bacterium]